MGGDGFLGSHFVDEAVKAGHAITVFDRFSGGHARNLEHQRGCVRFIAGEFANRDDVLQALRGQEIVYHFVSATNPATSWNNPFLEIEENLRHSVQLFELASKENVRKLVFMSSGGTVYGRQSGLIDETVLPRPFSPYGIGKCAIEHFLNYYHDHGYLTADIYRIGNAYGSRQPMHAPQGVIANWMARILDAEEIVAYGGADTVRDYVYVGDVARLLLQSVAQVSDAGIYNVGTGRGISITELLDIFGRVIDRPFRVRMEPRRDFDNPYVVLDSRRLIARCPGFQFSDFEEKLGETWEYVNLHYRKR